MPELTTFSIAARCAETGMLGVAVSTAVPCVGAICAFVEPGAGAIATQSWVNPYFGIDGLGLLAEGGAAQAVLDRLLAGDPGRDGRQLGIVDRHGATAAFTGSGCTGWCGHRTGDGYTVQGNMLTGAEVIDAMAASANETAGQPLPDRLMAALEAGQEAGGDKRGRQSAHLKVFQTERYPYLDVRVDDHPDPVRELRRVFEVAKTQFLPFMRGMPTHADPVGGLPEAVTAMLLKAPADR